PSRGPAPAARPGRDASEGEVPGHRLRRRLRGGRRPARRVPRPRCGPRVVPGRAGSPSPGWARARDWGCAAWSSPRRRPGADRARRCGPGLRRARRGRAGGCPHDPRGRVVVHHHPPNHPNPTMTRRASLS
ncbi:unnamed protein product, partial [Prorocentrum cordatum]